MRKLKIKSWGGLLSPSDKTKNISPDLKTQDISDIISSLDTASITPRGHGRSYGDLNLSSAKGTHLDFSKYSDIIKFDEKTGLLSTKSGTSLGEILKHCVPKGWFLPILPGTKFVSVGGAIANDIHGKSHHKTGSFGTCIKEISIYRSDVGHKTISPKHDPELFNLTIGGLGLTGTILSATLQLIPIESAQILSESISFSSVDEFFEISEQSKDWPYSVAWIDSLSKGKQLGRGVFMRGRHSTSQSLKPHNNKHKLQIPFYLPSFLLNYFSIKAFNFLYYNKPSSNKSSTVHYDTFFFPLDKILNWNKLYGKKGFYQYQAIIPKINAHKGIVELLEEIAKSKQGSFLSVLKNYAHEKSSGTLSFPLEGTSLALDFANRGHSTKLLLEKLDLIVQKHNGRLYPAKDALMSSHFYQSSYKEWGKLQKSKDPLLSNCFWERVTKIKARNMKTYLIVGASSTIAQSYIKLLIEKNKNSKGIKFILLSKSNDKISDTKELLDKNNLPFEIHNFDLAEEKSIESFWDNLGSVQVNEALISYGILSSENLFKMLNTNLTSTALWLEKINSHFIHYKNGKCIVLGSVAGDLSRKSNYLYGSTKSALDHVIKGLQHTHALNKNIYFGIIKPGFVNTSMTSHIEKKGILWSEPIVISNSIFKSFKNNKKVKYSPFYWKYIILILKFLPKFIFNRLNI